MPNRAAMESQREPLLDWPGALLVLLVAVLQFFRGGWAGFACWKPGVLSTLCVDPYWINQWLKNYAGGFTKRGLIGEVLRQLFPSGVDLVWLNAIAVVQLMAIALLLYGLMRVLLARGGLPPLLLSVLLLLAPFGKSLAETALDPLQLCVLLVSAVLFTPPRSALRDATVLVAFLLCSLIYEGCALLLLPVGYWLMRPLLWRWLPVVFAALLLLIFQQQDLPSLGMAAKDALAAVNPFTGEQIRYQDGGGLAASVSFSFNVKQEFSRYLSDSPRDTVSRIARSLGAVLVYALALWTAMGSKRPEERRMAGLIWLSWAPVALPFVLITHDWLRYGVVLLLLTLVVTVAQLPQCSQSEPWWQLSRPEAWAAGVLVMAVVVGPMTSDVRKFLPPDLFYASLLMLAVASTVALLESRRLQRLR